MFPPTDKPRVFRLGVGVDLAQAFVRGLDERTRTMDPMAVSQVQIFVNTQRLGRRISDVLSQGPARFHPKIAPVTSFGAHLVAPGQNNGLTHRLHLAELLRKRMRAEPSYGPASSAFALADSLLALFEEISGEGVSPGALFSLDVGQDHAAHLTRNLAFVKIARDYFETLDFSDEAARQRRAAELQIAEWSLAPPPGPVLVVGSTGSRGTTAMIMDAVAKLPNGAVVLPGFDAHVPDGLWAELGAGHRFEDHPQHRLAACLSRLDLVVDDVATWAGNEADEPRNRLISLALRPAPVTDAWLREGPLLGDPIIAMRSVALIEASSPREEALSIALELRAAAEQSLNGALVSPNRTLTRQVAAMLDRWGIVPDDSAGRPLGLLPPGQFLASLSGILADQPSAAGMLAVLKHPLCHSGDVGRDAHFLSRRALEQHLREDVEVRLTPGLLKGVAADEAWANWATAFLSSSGDAACSVGRWAQRLKTLAEHAGRGMDPHGAGQLWDKEAGKTALALMDRLIMEADAGGPLTGTEFRQTFLDLLSREDVRDALVVHPKIRIWGTLEARVQTADVVILAGLNEDIWPGAATADPWLNRKLRRDAGLLVP
ncbi:MAG: double-strand break repair protein AddB, partial [Pseudomonadota bacterium]